MKLHKLLLALLLCAAPSGAATITLNLASSSIAGVPGETLTFLGSISSTYGVTVDFNSISVNLNLGTGFLVDNLPFFLGPITVSANGNTGEFALFTVTANNPFLNPYGIYAGTISILGGAEVGGVYDPGILDLLTTTSFSVVVNNPATPITSAAIPEPATWPLVLAAGGSLWLYKRRRRG